jgi:predicted nuclease of predicted toxin-antitoxin system
MKLLLDANLSPAWVPVLVGLGHQVAHWFSIGKMDAPDSEILDWAAREGYTIITKDLDFGTLLTTRGLHWPSVIQLRVEDVSPASLTEVLDLALQRFAPNLEAGALLTVMPDKNRIRLLPIHKTPN